MSIMPRKVSAVELLDWLNQREATVKFVGGGAVVLTVGSRNVGRNTLLEAIESIQMSELLDLEYDK